jgi:isoleucyl-tRNA synthetase
MNNKSYKNVESNPDFAKIEQDILKYWNQNKVFEHSVNNRPAVKDNKNNEFVFYDGPPFANGLPHYGHLLTGFVKDVYARYQTQKGKKVERRFGWDCHGLPAEMGAEKELGISGRLKIMEYGIDKFNQHCRSSVLKYTNQWEEYVTRQGRWVDFQNDYKTMETPYMESVIWAFKELYDKGLIYKDLRVMPYSWACETPLSNFETRMDNSYREVADKAITVKFLLNEMPQALKGKCSTAHIMAWTTTPWTLPSNLALAVGDDIDYTAIIKDDSALIIAISSIKSYKKELGIDDEYKPEIIIKGCELKGLTYQPLFDYFKDHPNAFQILSGDFVTEGDGTGIVHMAPGFGEDDHHLCKKYNIDIVCPVDNSGKFTSEVADFVGLQVFDANDKIIIALKEKGLWLKTEQYLHNYPHCWRTDTPLIYKAVSSWYVEVTKFKDRMVELNQQINWIPNHIRDGLFGNWLENARDWSISRNRFWGTPIPVWQSDDPTYPRIDVYGSIEELKKDFGIEVTDLHKPFIDELTRPNPNDPTGKSMMHRVDDVFDCWFESGSMPYAQAHYPFENKEWFENHFPADFIVEYEAQTRGWFYTLMVLSTALFDRPPFLNCICHGVILDEKGQKLSKRLNNYANPLDVFEQYGSDSLRWLMMKSSVMRGNELLIDKDCKMVREVIRLAIKPIWNAYHFFTMYANADQVTAKIDLSSNNIMDIYILSKLHVAISKIEKSLDEFDSITACEVVEGFFEVLNNWYIRRNRSRFWQKEIDDNKIHAYNTLYSVLNIMCTAIAPLLPFTTEAIYSGLRKNDEMNAQDSVHMALFPEYKSLPYDSKLIDDMDKIQEICNAALAIRNNENIRIRQPLNALTIVGSDYAHLDIYSDLIKDELNVKNTYFSTELETYASLKLSINFQVLGKRIPAKIKEIIPASKAGKWNQNSDGTITISGENLLESEYSLLLEPKDKKSCNSLSSQNAIVMFDLNLTDELIQEGKIRDLVRAIQQARKDLGFDISDHVIITIKTSDLMQKAIANFQDYICQQTLSKIDLTDHLDVSKALSSNIENEELLMTLEKDNG